MMDWTTKQEKTLRIITAIIFLITIALGVTAQERYKPNYKHYAVGLSLSFISGVADGYSEVVAHHYPRFQERHPNADPNYWSKSLGWKSHWVLDDNGNPITSQTDDGLLWVKNDDVYMKEPFFLASRTLVGLTDFYHLTRLIDKKALVTGTIVIQLNQKNKPWYWYFIDMFLGGMARSIGFNLIHEWIY